MAKNEFLPFGIAEGANVLSNQEYERLAARFNGFVSGVAKSKELNTVWRQSSVMSSALAQFIVDSDNKDLLDNGDVASVKNRLVAAFKQTISGVGYVTTAAMNLELNKKFDKANISGVKGNDNDKVPSLNLLTNEVGKLQPKGNYQEAGYSYSKIESDSRYQPKGNYAPAGDYATNSALNNGLALKFDKTSVTQQAGQSTTQVMSQKIVTEGLANRATIEDLAKKFDKDSVLQVFGSATDKTMSQKVITDAIANRATLAQLDGKFDKSNVVQVTGASTTQVMSQKAVTDLVSAHGLGYGQTYKDVTSQRQKGVVYTNSSSKPILLSISTVYTPSKGESNTIEVSGVLVSESVVYTGTQSAESLQAIVPPGGRYKYDGKNVKSWVELS